MTAITDPPRADFRLGMLWTDTRYRSLTIQVIALILVLLGASYLVSNVLANLAALGKDFSFGILTGPASYDINQRLIDYTSRSSHTTAAVVGMLNTLLVAVMGCLLATVIGVVAGVLRLSNNWLISKLMTVYIETVRNIPVLIQILLLAAVFDEFLPSPRQAGADAHMLGIVATNRGFYIPGPVFGAGSVFVVAALILGIVGSVWYARHAKRVQQETGRLLPIWRVRLGLIVGLPFVVWAAIALVAGAPITLAYPELQGFNFDGGIYMRNSLVALWLALSIYTGAFIAENVRAGILSVSKGQTEAAYALGLRANRTMSLVILPQALRVIIPPLISQYLNLTKNSSLAIAVGYMDATGTLGGITLNQTGREFETLLLLMAFYLSISLTISMIMNLYNEQVKLVERTSASGTAFSFGKLFDSMTGPWDTLKKGDAAHQPNFGVASWLNLVVLLYAGMLAAELAFLFLADVPELRRAYFDWTLVQQLTFLLLVTLTLSTLLTAVFKHFRVIDLAVGTLAMWIVALLAGNPLGLMIPSLPSILVVVGCAAAQLGAIAYLVFGARPNVTYFCRVRRDG
ncbi:L-glutamine ABC transporter membrane protein /L-glutamate ABC transporter membrane protein /L-aspartate ABC transporter membrane protein /L-asparagine ABC transporter membrane protein [Albimonas pacifica]|uniref:L-glutamine ABC transporter membrane protein /L-glutamate ABC transporter membrane protein /L-aspartate ABC transporter membrane protein /L-asparagine ABC transporter membrane protein n=1 Tax=Albimonas pacifica TaxID=1114924 RepID=A0A1I3MY19_9RHOB|nr:L-glutamine ABC transporter membrane protein /L-glutamate ABC transporter membrane protein /L-aspartate ABC transporter membrane protein /L-asparagine ABC transporter membrane protein [Albimonas pacifica]